MTSAAFRPPIPSICSESAYQEICLGRSALPTPAMNWGCPTAVRTTGITVYEVRLSQCVNHAVIGSWPRRRTGTVVLGLGKHALRRWVRQAREIRLLVVPDDRSPHTTLSIVARIGFYVTTRRCKLSSTAKLHVHPEQRQSLSSEVLLPYRHHSPKSYQPQIHRATGPICPGSVLTTLTIRNITTFIS